MSYLDWHVGMKVVCVIGGGHRWHEDMESLAEGGVYTIRGMNINPATGNLNVLVDEIRNPARQCAEGFGEPYYGARRFRPVQTRKTDISIFEAMLTGARPKVPA